jgi:hypothetical protein
MALKISRGVWLVSILGVLAALLTVYASMPEEVMLLQEGVSYISTTKEILFYVALGMITVANALVFIVSFLYKPHENFRAWFNGLIVIVNIFFVITLFFLNVTNSTERFNYSNIGFLLYGSVALTALWILVLPLGFMIRKFLLKETI